jgi:hypothetical protein
MSTQSAETIYHSLKPEFAVPTTAYGRVKKMGYNALSRFGDLTHRPETQITPPTSDEILAHIPAELPSYRRLAIAADLHDHLASTLDNTSTIDPVIDTLSHAAINDFSEWEKELELKPHERSKEKANPIGLSIEDVLGCIRAWEVHQSVETEKSALKAIGLAGGEWSTRFDTAFYMLLEERKVNKNATTTFMDALKKVNLERRNGEPDFEGLYSPDVPIEIKPRSPGFYAIK